MRQRHGPVQRHFGNSLPTVDQLLRGLRDVPTTAVVKADIENQALVLRRV